MARARVRAKLRVRMSWFCSVRAVSCACSSSGLCAAASACAASAPSEIRWLTCAVVGG